MRRKWYTNSNASFVSVLEVAPENHHLYITGTFPDLEFHNAAFYGIKPTHKSIDKSNMQSAKMVSDCNFAPDVLEIFGEALDSLLHLAETLLHIII